MKKEKKNSILKIILVMQKKKKRMESITTSFDFSLSLSLSLCRGLFALSSRFISTTLHHDMPCHALLYPKDIVSNV